MYAIVEIAGQQFKVEKGQKLYVHRLEQKEGSDVEFSNVMLLEKDGKVDVGQPFVEGVKISAKILEHVKGDKVLVFKKKRRKGYQKLNGHRQLLSRIEVEEILEKGAKPAKKESKTSAEKKEETPAPAVKKETKAKKPAKKTETKKAQPKKSEAKTTKKEATKTTAKKATTQKTTTKSASTTKKAAAKPKATAATKKTTAKKEEKKDDAGKKDEQKTEK